MSVLDEMLSLRQKFEDKDRHDAMNVMTFLLHYEVSFRLGSEKTFTLFRNENDLSAFCTNNEVKVPVMQQVIDEMRAEGLIAPENMPVILTELGVEKLCQ